MSVIAFAIACAKLALLAIILYYVVEMLTAMPVHMRRVCQALIILIAAFAAIDMVVGNDGSSARMPSLGHVPSIIAPERR